MERRTLRRRRIEAAMSLLAHQNHCVINGLDRGATAAMPVIAAPDHRPLVASRARTIAAVGGANNGCWPWRRP